MAFFLLGLSCLILVYIFYKNQWSLEWLTFAFSDDELKHPLVSSVVASVLMSIIAICYPLRVPKAELGRTGIIRTEHPRWGLFALAVSITLAGIIYWVEHFIDEYRGEEKTRALLAGDENIKLRSIQIEYQMRRIECSDPTVLRYLEEQFRLKRTDAPVHPSTTYLLTMTYAGGGKCSILISWYTDDALSLYLEDLGVAEEKRGILLIRPRPEGIDKIINFLGMHDSDTPGSVLILGKGGSRVERDPSQPRHSHARDDWRHRSNSDRKA